MAMKLRVYCKHTSVLDCFRGFVFCATLLLLGHSEKTRKAFCVLMADRLSAIVQRYKEKHTFFVCFGNLLILFMLITEAETHQ